MSSLWNESHRRWSRLGPPLRPHKDAVAAVRRAIAGQAARVLLLGVTPELADLGVETIAVDRNPGMIANIWPGDTARRRAQLGDWLSLDLPDEHFTAAIGDGTLNNLLHPDGHSALYASVARVLRPGGIFASRVALTPDDPETMETVVSNAWARRIEVFNAFKWRVAMAIAAANADPNVPVMAILDSVNRHVPDRDALAAATGWERADIDTIDAYENSPEIFSFPTMAQIRAVIPRAFQDVRVLPSGAYPLAERCPLLVMVRGL
jgi:SAM-dependent methyltransferase